MSSPTWFVDSSVLLRAILDGSEAVREWFTSQSAENAAWMGSRMLDLEVRRQITNAGLEQSYADQYLHRFDFLAVTDQQIDAAIALPYTIGGADGLHVVAAHTLRSAGVPLTFVTHDAQQARAVAAMNVGFTAFDPVTDDPRRPPVA